MTEPKDKSLGVAILLNVFLPGVGYMYLGRLRAGIVALVFVVPLIVMTAGIAWFAWLIVMTIDMLLLHKKHQERVAAATMKKCPRCAEDVKAAAKVCKHCGHEFLEAPTMA